MILNANKIREFVEAGEIKIEPFVPDLLKPASYTFTLGSEYGQLPKTGELDGRNATSVSWHPLPASGFLLPPGGFILGVSRERVELRGNAMCLISTRAAVAQAGLCVTQGSFFAEPDTCRCFTLEIGNCGPLPIRLFAGQRIAQGIFII